MNSPAGKFASGLPLGSDVAFSQWQNSPRVTLQYEHSPSNGTRCCAAAVDEADEPNGSSELAATDDDDPAAAPAAGPAAFARCRRKQVGNAAYSEAIESSVHSRAGHASSSPVATNGRSAWMSARSSEALGVACRATGIVAV